SARFRAEQIENLRVRFHDLPGGFPGVLGRTDIGVDEEEVEQVLWQGRVQLLPQRPVVTLFGGAVRHFEKERRPPLSESFNVTDIGNRSIARGVHALSFTHKQDGRVKHTPSSARPSHGRRARAGSYRIITSLPAALTTSDSKRRKYPPLGRSRPSSSLPSNANSWNPGSNVPCASWRTARPSAV